MENMDVAVIGGGVIGTSTAMALLERHHRLKLTVFEKEKSLAAHQTGHNSGVIHSGLYYRPGSLKAQHCISGRLALYQFCSERGIPHEQCGKIIVATKEEEIPALEELEKRGKENGLKGLERLDGKGVCQYEPYATGIAGLFVPQTGIVDYVKVTEAYAEVIVSHGGQVRTSCRVNRVKGERRGFLLETSQGNMYCHFLINCAGLYCDQIARICGVDIGVRIIPFRGEYYAVKPSRRGLVKNSIYPVPDPAFPFLGVHFTRMISGELEAGPDAVLAFKREGYGRLDFSPSEFFGTLVFPGFWKLARRYWKVGAREYGRSFCKAAFVEDLKRLVPGLRKEDVSRGRTGVRAQAVDRDGRLLDDFCIAEGEAMIHVLNAPSPAATASMSLGQTIAGRAAEKFGLNSPSGTDQRKDWV